MQAFPAAPMLPACACARCDAHARADALLIRHRATNVTTVRTPGSTPEFKAYVTLEDADKSGRGSGQSESQAILEALGALGAT